MSEKKKVAIIGGGLAGITTVKQLRDEGHDVICFEKGASIGGVFAPSGCYDSTMLTISNYFMAFSYFLPQDERLTFRTRREYDDYLTRYVEHYQLAAFARVPSYAKGVEPSGARWQICVEGSGVDTAPQVNALAVGWSMFTFHPSMK